MSRVVLQVVCPEPDHADQVLIAPYWPTTVTYPKWGGWQIPGVEPGRRSEVLQQVWGKDGREQNDSHRGWCRKVERGRRCPHRAQFSPAAVGLVLGAVVMPDGTPMSFRVGLDVVFRITEPEMRFLAGRRNQSERIAQYLATRVHATPGTRYTP